ncbi:MAG TPA: RNA polymerase sigma factor RpoH [Alphaproteobacteria bacterium]|nr:RNA polymerase sigma factor RpoH [Rhodospirillaceae bacterium]HRJ12860.1 RNA polymerase sigma factor RpoH [Alphaproteobacteria bacterium]
MTYAMPALISSTETSLSRYLQDIQRFPMLTADEEYMLGRRVQEDGDREAAHQLITSHLRLVAKVAFGYRGYGLPVADLIAEGNIGLMQAVKKFDPERGFRLATYAMWWIKASIQEFVLRSWSLVKMGTTAAQKKLFFGLKKAKAAMNAMQDGDLTPEQVNEIADRLNVHAHEVIEMNGRLSAHDASLNAPLAIDGDMEWQDVLTDDNAIGAENNLMRSDEQDHRAARLYAAMDKLKAREREIFTARRLAENPKTLEELAADYGISRERVRQIEAKAYEKIEKLIQAA